MPQVANKRVTALSMLGGFDDDLADQIVQVFNRIRDLLTQPHPARSSDSGTGS